MPLIHTGVSVNSFALSSEANKTADAPSHKAQQSSNLMGSAIFLEDITSSKVIRLLKSALGFSDAVLRFFTETVAICSSVVPYFLMCAFANIAAQCTGSINV